MLLCIVSGDKKRWIGQIPSRFCEFQKKNLNLPSICFLAIASSRLTLAKVSPTVTLISKTLMKIYQQLESKEDKLQKDGIAILKISASGLLELKR
jgi:hypothetical protein